MLRHAVWEDTIHLQLTWLTYLFYIFYLFIYMISPTSKEQSRKKYIYYLQTDYFLAVNCNYSSDAIIVE